MDNIANLAKLNFSKDEKEELQIYIENLLDYVEVLKEVDVYEEDTYITVLEGSFNAETRNLRDDNIEDSFSREAILKNAPSKKDGFFSVPNVLG